MYFYFIFILVLVTFRLSSCQESDLKTKFCQENTGPKPFVSIFSFLNILYIYTKNSKGQVWRFDLEANKFYDLVDLNTVFQGKKI